MRCSNCNEHASGYRTFITTSWFSGRPLLCKNCGEELNPGPFNNAGNYLIVFLAPIAGIVFSNTVDIHVFDKQMLNTFVLELPLLGAMVFLLTYLLWLFGKYKKVKKKA